MSSPTKEKDTVAQENKAEAGNRETFVLYSIDREILAQRLQEAQKTRPEYTKSHVLRDMIRATDEKFYQ